MSLRWAISSSMLAVAALAASSRNCPASLSRAIASWASKPARWADTSCCAAPRTPGFHRGNSSSASFSRKPVLVFSRLLRCASTATGSPDIQLDAALSRAANSLRRLPSARALALSCQAASSACLRVGWPVVCANASPAMAARQSDASNLKRLSLKNEDWGKVNNMFSEVNKLR